MSSSSPAASTLPVTGPAFPPISTPSTPPTIDPSIQSSLLALLTQAANAMNSQPNGQTTANTSPLVPSTIHVPTAPTSTPQLTADQLQLLQRLAQTAKLAAAGPPVPSAPSSSAVVPSIPPAVSSAVKVPENSQQNSLPYRDDHYRSGQSRYGRRDEPEHGRNRGGRPNGYRDGFREASRGRGKGRWDDHGGHENMDTDRGPSHRRRSRSRSPPRGRYGERRDVKPYSPPPRQPITSMAAREQEQAAAGSSNPRKDEFGRDVRVPEDGTSISSNDRYSRSPLSASCPRTLMTTAANTALGWTHSISRPLILLRQHRGKSAGGMVGQSVMPVQPQNGYQEGHQGWAAGPTSRNGNWQGTRGGGHFPRGGRGGYMYGSGREGQGQWDYQMNEQASDAIVLGGDTDPVPLPESDMATGIGGGVPAGRMQRVGDRWMFVRAGGGS